MPLDIGFAVRSTSSTALRIGIYLGKLDIAYGDENELAHDYRTQFTNLGLQKLMTLPLPLMHGAGARSQ